MLLLTALVENELRLTPGADAFALTQVAESSLAAYDCARE
jgi:hypothetical protein